eukprot:CAMPEP_0181328678 /NCGR_PEP_ID=MMETSP1101-20121128/22867_1 /TAXON_ID=46948 /ORGANISM="Rhodomonas abbreviata, Strain Caron Lab Isolate" /LENGTH=295 /DNA_ID=CAMNT_0023437629 /DNA_START=168 /DNA_END=1056 /DNA_ORIENTATION=-
MSEMPMNLNPLFQGNRAKAIDKLLAETGAYMPKINDDHKHSIANYFSLPKHTDIMKGETKTQYRDRLREAFNMVEEDEFTFTFYEKFWPSFKNEKRVRAAERGEKLAPHLAQLFEEDEAEESWFVPYSEVIRSELGNVPNVSSFLEALLPLSDMKDPEASPEDALWEGCQRGASDEEIFECAARADVDARDTGWYNWTAAHYAAERGHVAVVEVLIALQADMWPEDDVGRRPVDLANERGHLRVVEALHMAIDLDDAREDARDPEPMYAECPKDASRFDDSSSTSAPSNATYMVV